MALELKLTLLITVIASTTFMAVLGGQLDLVKQSLAKAEVLSQKMEHAPEKCRADIKTAKSHLQSAAEQLEKLAAINGAPPATNKVAQIISRDRARVTGRSAHISLLSSHVSLQNCKELLASESDSATALFSSKEEESQLKSLLDDLDQSVKSAVYPRLVHGRN